MIKCELTWGKDFMYPDKKLTIYFHDDVLKIGDVTKVNTYTEMWEILQPPYRYFHNDKGPAVFIGEGEEYYYLNGVSYQKEDWEREVKRRKFADKMYGVVND